MEEDQGEVKIFQRREKRKEEDRAFLPPLPAAAAAAAAPAPAAPSFYSSRPSSNAKIWRDPDAVEKSLGRDAGSPEHHERMKKMKDLSEKPDRPWKDGEYNHPQQQLKEPVPWKEKEDYHSHPKNPHQKEKGHFMSRADPHPWKDRGFEEKNPVNRDREERGHENSNRSNGSKDQDTSRGYGGEDGRVHVKGRRSFESRDSYSRPRSIHGFGEEKPHGGQRSSPASYDHENPMDSVHQIENTSAGFSQSSYQESRGGDEQLPLTKLKLKMGGLPQNSHLDARKRSEGEDRVKPKVKKRSTLSLEPNKRRQRLILQDCSDEDIDAPDVPQRLRKHVHTSEEDGFLAYLADEPSYRRIPGGSNFSGTQNLTGIRKSSRVPKKRVFDGDDDIEAEPKKRRRKKVEIDSEEDLYRIEDEDMDQDMADEEMMDTAAEGGKVKAKRRKKSLEGDLYIRGPDSFKGGDSPDTRVTAGIPLTARQRALQSSKEGIADIGASLVEFPEGLTLAAPKKVKDSLTAAERQVKKEEAALKRKQQVEKAAKEQQASAMQKVLNQDSQRKKREGKRQKQREELEQEKKAAELAPATNSIRWVIGANGTVVSFSQDLELPMIFSGPVSYPQEREQCAGPSCTNKYKYRDSKTLIPLCSLQCYRAVQKPSTEAALAN